MSDPEILHAGVLCLGLAVVGMLSTVHEFRKMGARRQPSKPRAGLAFQA